MRAWGVIAVIISTSRSASMSAPLVPGSVQFPDVLGCSVVKGASVRFQTESALVDSLVIGIGITVFHGDDGHSLSIRCLRKLATATPCRWSASLRAPGWRQTPKVQPENV